MFVFAVRTIWYIYDMVRQYNHTSWSDIYKRLNDSQYGKWTQCNELSTGPWSLTSLRSLDRHKYNLCCTNAISLTKTTQRPDKNCRRGTLTSPLSSLSHSLSFSVYLTLSLILISSALSRIEKKEKKEQKGKKKDKKKNV